MGVQHAHPPGRETRVDCFPVRPEALLEGLLPVPLAAFPAVLGAVVERTGSRARVPRGPLGHEVLCGTASPRR